MIQSNLSEIKTKFSSYIEMVEKGETVVVCKRNIPIAEIKPIKHKTQKKRPVGLAQKKYPDFVLSDDVVESVPNDVIDLFYGIDE